MLNILFNSSFVWNALPTRQSYVGIYCAQKIVFPNIKINLSNIFLLNFNIDWFVWAFAFVGYDFPPPVGYEFVEKLGVGGCGKVYLAKHLETETLYAVKCVKIIESMPYTNLVSMLSP